MIIGYARDGVGEELLDVQRDALRAAGCEKLFEDLATGVAVNRPGWSQARAALRGGDTLVVWRLDRLGHSLTHLRDTIADLDNAGVGFRSLTENLDTGRIGGKLVLGMIGALADFEHQLIRERTIAGLAAARTRGRSGGRPRKLDARMVDTARRMLASSSHSVTEIAASLGVSRSTLYRALKSPPETGA